MEHTAGLDKAVGVTDQIPVFHKDHIVRLAEWGTDATRELQRGRERIAPLTRLGIDVPAAAVIDNEL